MPRRRGMTGPGAGVMGGPGARPRVAPTAMAGRGAGAPPPGAAAGMLGPMPGGQPRPGGGMGGAPGFARGGHISKEKEEDIMEKKRKRHEALALGGPVGGHGGKDKPLDYPRNSPKKHSQDRQMERDHRPRSKHGEMEKQISEGKAGFKRGGAPGFTKSSAYEKGGYVDTAPPQSAPGRGVDTKPRVGRDTAKATHGD